MSGDSLEVARRFISKIEGIQALEFGYKGESVQWIDGFLDRLRDSQDYDESFALEITNALGKFYGDCIIECYGGCWKEDAGGWQVCIKEGVGVYPLNKMLKQLKNTDGDSVYHMYGMVPELIARSKSV